MAKIRVFITGDTHCPIDIGKLQKKRFTVGRNLNKNDIVIICGDSGFVWDNQNDAKWINWISKQKWTTIFCDGNHENHDLLNQYPVVCFHGAKTHKISDSLYHVKRGEIMTINGESYFFFGGGFSHDIFTRTEHITWWQSELPNEIEINNALINLKKKNFKIDYIITHDAPYIFRQKLGYSKNEMKYYHTQFYDICKFLDFIKSNTQYRKWFLGHYHIDRDMEEYDAYFLYNRIIEIKQTKELE